MGNHAAWLLLSFAIMVVAVLARLSDKVEKLEKRLERLEALELSDTSERSGLGSFGTDADSAHVEGAALTLRWGQLRSRQAPAPRDRNTPQSSKAGVGTASAANVAGVVRVRRGERLERILTPPQPFLSAH